MQPKKIAFAILFLFLFSNLPCLAQIPTYEIVNGKKYEAAYFFPISGEVYGQAASGVSTVLINGEKAPIDSDGNFKANVSLAQDQKYILVETHYQGLKFIKKYLMLFHLFLLLMTINPIVNPFFIRFPVNDN